ncbi:MAG: hypothetical protein QGH20_01035, partial [Candidatus Latescibacteria bacterium]|nr:hypothetical protein [Candidatus Latescibacterota bacterium]
TPDDAVRFVKESALGLKLASDYLTVGANMGGFSEQAKTMYEQLYESDVSWDYIGTDGYFGTWEEGGPHTWHTALDWLVELTPLPVYAMEWGYSSAGKIMPPEKVIPDNTDPHAEGMWCFGWDDDGTVKSHDFEVQALYIEQTMAILADRVAGIFYYCWRDSQSCACGNEGCPVEANWGLVDTNGDPKPSYHALKRCIAELDD